MIHSHGDRQVWGRKPATGAGCIPNTPDLVSSTASSLCPRIDPQSTDNLGHWPCPTRSGKGQQRLMQKSTSWRWNVHSIFSRGVLRLLSFDFYGSPAREALLSPLCWGSEAQRSCQLSESSQQISSGEGTRRGPPVPSTCSLPKDAHKLTFQKEASAPPKKVPLCQESW